MSSKRERDAWRATPTAPQPSTHYYPALQDEDGLVHRPKSSQGSGKPTGHEAARDVGAGSTRPRRSSLKSGGIPGPHGHQARSMALERVKGGYGSMNSTGGSQTNEEKRSGLDSIPLTPPLPHLPLSSPSTPDTKAFRRHQGSPRSSSRFPNSPLPPSKASGYSPSYSPTPQPQPPKVGHNAGHSSSTRSRDASRPSSPPRLRSKSKTRTRRPLVDPTSDSDPDLSGFPLTTPLLPSVVSSPRPPAVPMHDQGDKFREHPSIDTPKLDSRRFARSTSSQALTPRSRSRTCLKDVECGNRDPVIGDVSPCPTRVAKSREPTLAGNEALERAYENSRFIAESTHPARPTIDPVAPSEPPPLKHQPGTSETIPLHYAHINQPQSQSAQIMRSTSTLHFSRQPGLILSPPVSPRGSADAPPSPASRRKRAPTLGEEDRPTPSLSSQAATSTLARFSPPLRGSATTSTHQALPKGVSSRRPNGTQDPPPRQDVGPGHRSPVLPIYKKADRLVSTPTLDTRSRTTSNASPLTNGNYQTPKVVYAPLATRPAKHPDQERRSKEAPVETPSREQRRRANALLGLVDGLGLGMNLEETAGSSAQPREYMPSYDDREPRALASFDSPVAPSAWNGAYDLVDSPDTSGSTSRWMDPEPTFNSRAARSSESEPEPIAPPPTPSSTLSEINNLTGSKSRTLSEGTGTSASLSEGTSTSLTATEFDTDESESISPYISHRSARKETTKNVVDHVREANSELEQFSLTRAESFHRISASPLPETSRVATPDPAASTRSGKQALFLALEQPCQGLGIAMAGTRGWRDSGLWEDADVGVDKVWHPVAASTGRERHGDSPPPEEDNTPSWKDDSLRPLKEKPSSSSEHSERFRSYTFPNPPQPDPDRNPPVYDSLPVPQPKIVIQPSTSSSDNGSVHRRGISNDSASTYSDVVGDQDMTVDAQWSTPGSGNNGLSNAAKTLFRGLDDAAAHATAAPTWACQPPALESTHASGRLVTTSSLQLPLHPKTWRSTLPGDAYQSLCEKYGAFEMRRQEVIWELCTTEQNLVQCLRVVLQLFIQPLRSGNQRRWLPGVPAEVRPLFESLEDIVQLHSHISSALLDVRNAQYPVVIQVAEALRPFVSKLELHQPYLVRLEGVSQLIEDSTRDPTSDFGDFIRGQTNLPECGSMSLSSFLLKPVQRIMKYPLFFRQLWDLTPRNHPDYLATFSLFHSTDMVIRVMNEVKAREEEHELVKSLGERIKGLPDGFTLAQRERRLVAQGLLRRIIISEKDQATTEGHDSPLPSPALPLHSPSITSATSPSLPQRSSPSLPSHLSKLMPITSPHFTPSRLGAWEQPTERAGSSLPQYRPDSTASESSQISASSAAAYENSFTDGTRSTTSSVFLMSPSGTDYSLRPDSMASSSAGVDLYDHPLNAHSHYGSSRFLRRNNSLRGSLRKRESQVYVFVFTDFLLLTTPLSEKSMLRSPRGGEKKECWKVLEDIGMSRILGVQDQSGKLGHDHLISLELLPMTAGRGASDSLETPTALHLSLPERMTSRMALAPRHVLQDARTKWLEAFQQCFHCTLRALLHPSLTSEQPAKNINRTVDAAPPLSITSIFSSGLPFPSLGVDEAGREKKSSAEGNDMAWWSKQFHQVLREMEVSNGKLLQSNGASSVFGPSTILQRSRQPRPNELKRTSITGGPRPLLLASHSHAASPTMGVQQEEKRGLLRSFSKKGR